LPIVRVESQKHPVLQTLRELQTEKGRQDKKLFHVEGPMVVRRALDYGGIVPFVVLVDRFAASTDAADILEAARYAGAAVYEVTEGLMSKIVPAKPAPSIVAGVERRLHSPSGLLEGQSPLIVLIDRCDNPDNLGMLLRSLDAAGVDGVALTSDSVDPFNRLCVRASRGSVLSLKLTIVPEPDAWVREAKDRGYRVFASSAHGSSNFWEADLRGQVVAVVGNEHTGVRDTIRDAADKLIYIPMAGKMESLNIAVAGAIIAYEAARQRQSR
jgi:RNA methyltransferase, TrmH family